MVIIMVEAQLQPHTTTMTRTTPIATTTTTISDG